MRFNQTSDFFTASRFDPSFARSQPLHDFMFGESFGFKVEIIKHTDWYLYCIYSLLSSMIYLTDNVVSDLVTRYPRFCSHIRHSLIQVYVVVYIA